MEFKGTLKELETIQKALSGQMKRATVQLLEQRKEERNHPANTEPKKAINYYLEELEIIRSLQEEIKKNIRQAREEEQKGKDERTKELIKVFGCDYIYFI